MYNLFLSIINKSIQKSIILRIIYYLLFIIYYLLFIIYYLLFIIYIDTKELKISNNILNKWNSLYILKSMTN